MNWPQDHHGYPGGQPMGMFPPPPPPRPPRRVPVLAIAAAVVVGLALVIGIPVGLLVVGGENVLPAGPPAAGAAPGAGTPAGPVSTPAQPSTEPAAVPSAAPPPAVPPAGLSPAQQDLWSALTFAGVDGASCRGYPPGEAVTGRVVASIECTVADPGFTEPIVYYRFPDGAAVEEYLALRSAEVDRFGDCAVGAESDGVWSAGGAELGRLVCVDNTKEGTTFFKMVWSSNTQHTVAVIQDESPADTYAWWLANGNVQFAA